MYKYSLQKNIRKRKYIFLDIHVSFKICIVIVRLLNSCNSVYEYFSSICPTFSMLSWPGFFPLEKFCHVCDQQLFYYSQCIVFFIIWYTCIYITNTIDLKYQFWTSIFKCIWMPCQQNKIFSCLAFNSTLTINFCHNFFCCSLYNRWCSGYILFSKTCFSITHKCVINSFNP